MRVILWRKTVRTISRPDTPPPFFSFSVISGPLPVSSLLPYISVPLGLFAFFSRLSSRKGYEEKKTKTARGNDMTLSTHTCSDIHLIFIPICFPHQGSEHMRVPHQNAYLKGKTIDTKRILTLFDLPSDLPLVPVTGALFCL